jgi:molybdopterin molybdotransferase
VERVRIEGRSSQATRCAVRATTWWRATRCWRRHVVRPAVAGVLASVNARRVRVFPPARVAVLSTGDELVDDGSPARSSGQIRESNKVMLLRLVAQPGPSRWTSASCETTRPSWKRCSAGRRGHLRRHRHQRRRQHGRLRRGQGGARPHRRHALDADRHQAGQALRVRAARRRDGVPCPVFGLPGNPVSSLVSFELLARPALRR